ncbi:MAG TPA: transglycosylase SLT domain-containing protein [Saprospiraceae bacterium]|nr:transglycosylase SLT domain-containing protein [Saprospiraceae bacterium]HRO08946.1 transglycosylase SLT domain-containing protein [Saprospiraceae bacterium]HRO73028.1 transglycosylase SLT domain-containing protein [Saprospiraceae bacterium]HRP42190.1 transglycosylase SLT domain-containing protein [Saprospiraceae bacterium]
MNTLKFITSNFVMVFIFVCFFGLESYANTPGYTEIQKRIDNLNTIINVKLTDDVNDFINKYVVKRRAESAALLGRTSLYFPYIENVIREKGLPDELKYIAVIESNLNPTGVSHQGAAGIWQFMKGTAELYGLTINKYIDERKDLIKSTEKALDHLKDLYVLYNDWTLAIAAYNCGSGTLNKAIKRANGETDFWKLKKYLPKETQNYIPRFIAASYLMNYYYLHDLQPLDPSEEIKFVLTVKVNNHLDMDRISKELDIDAGLIKYLNPVYNKDVIPGSSDKELTLTLPDTKMLTYIEKYANETDVIDNAYGLCRVRYNENLGLYMVDCSNQKTSLKALSTRNAYAATRDNLKENKKLSELAKNLQIIQPVFPSLYRLKRKESLVDVAKSNNIPLEDLLAINNIDINKGVAPGSLIKLSR